MFIEMIQGINGDCDFTSLIKESSLVEKIKKVSRNYYNFLFCIMDNYDLILSMTPDNDKKLIFKKRILEISSKIDEDPENYYSNMGYNERNMKKKIIQLNLHNSMDNNYNISSLLYLNDLYKMHFIFVDLNKREYYDTTVKNYDKIYLCLRKNKFILSKNIPENLTKKDINESIFNIDVKNIYKTYLESISKYKIGDLKDIAIQLNIPLKENNKNKNKQKLYDEINMIKMKNKFD